MARLKEHVASRNRASPARLVKLYKTMSPDQKKLISDAGFGGLLEIKTSSLPLDLVGWLLSCFDSESCCLLIPGRGSIKLTAEFVYNMFQLPNQGSNVLYEFDVDAINFIHERYGIENGKAPEIRTILKRLKLNKNADEDYLRSWIMLAISTFLCPTTSLTISPRCYPSVVDVSKLGELNWCQFVVDSLKRSAQKMSKRNSVGGCLLLLVLLYLDSLEVDKLEIPACEPRIGAWNKPLIDKVIRLDQRAEGVFGRLKLKKTSGISIQESLFGPIDDMEKFVFSKAQGVSMQKKRKLCEIVQKATVTISEAIGQLVGDISQLIASDDNQAADEDGPRRSKRTKPNQSSERHSLDHDASDEDKHDSSESEEDSEDVYADEDDEEEEEEDEEVEEGYEVDDGDEEEDAQESSDSEPDGNSQQPSVSNKQQQQDLGEEQRQQDAFHVVQPDQEDLPEDEEVPLVRRSSRLRNIQVLSSQSPKKNCNDDSTPKQATLVDSIEGTPSPKTKAGQDKCVGTGQRRRQKLRLKPKVEVVNLVTPKCVGEGSVEQPVNIIDDDTTAAATDGNSAQRTTTIPPTVTPRNAMDFEPPSFDLHIYSQSPIKAITYDQTTYDPAVHNQLPLVVSPQRNQVLDVSYGSTDLDDLIDSLSEETLKKIEEDAIRNNIERKENLAHSERTKVEEPGDASEVKTPAPTGPRCSSEPGTSGTAPFQPAPRRTVKLLAALQSPYVDYTKKISFKCTKYVNMVYNAVVKACSGRRTKSSQSPKQQENIINYLDYYVTLEHLSLSVRPCGELINTTAEIGISSLNCLDPKIKFIMPLRVSTFLLQWDITRADVKRNFVRALNHLDRKQLVFFPVLQR